MGLGVGTCQEWLLLEGRVPTLKVFPVPSVHMLAPDFFVGGAAPSSPVPWPGLLLCQAALRSGWAQKPPLSELLLLW